VILIFISPFILMLQMVQVRALRALFFREREKNSAGRIQDTLHTKVMQYVNRFGVKDRGRKEADFHVLRETHMPAVLLENLFIDHPEDAELLADESFVKGLSMAIGEGVAEALEIQKKADWKSEAVEWLFQEGLLTDEQWKTRPEEPLPLWAVAILLRRLAQNNRQVK
jgi:hypothetical protein